MPQFVIEQGILGAGNLSDAELKGIASAAAGRAEVDSAQELGQLEKNHHSLIDLGAGVLSVKT